MFHRHKSGQCLYTCAVRPAAIYGPGEDRHLPRIISLAKLGLLPFTIGGTGVKGDWIYIDNLVLALILASMGLLDDIPGKDRHPIAAGQSYFVNDGNDQMIFQSNLYSLFTGNTYCIDFCSLVGLSNNLEDLQIQIISQNLTLVKKRNCKSGKEDLTFDSKC